MAVTSRADWFRVEGLSSAMGIPAVTLADTHIQRLLRSLVISLYPLYIPKGILQGTLFSRNSLFFFFTSLTCLDVLLERRKMLHGLHACRDAPFGG